MNNFARFIGIFIYISSTTSLFAQNAGKISFSGLIIEEANCQVETLNKNLKVDCYNNGTTAITHDILFESQLKYLNQEKTLAVMQLTYN